MRPSLAFSLRDDTHGDIHELFVEERYAPFHAPGRPVPCSPAGSRTGAVCPICARSLRGRAPCIGRFVEIEVTAEKLVGSFAGKDHFDTHRLDYAGEQVHRRRSPHGGHIVGLEVIDDIPQRIQALLDRVVDFVVHGADVVG